MNLHAVVRSAIGAINPDTIGSVLVSAGYTAAPNGQQVPHYSRTNNVPMQVQALSSKEIEHLDSLNIQNVSRAVYINEHIEGLDRTSGKGGDLLVFNKTTWLIVATLETWGESGGEAFPQPLFASSAGLGLYQLTVSGNALCNTGVGGAGSCDAVLNCTLGTDLAYDFTIRNDGLSSAINITIGGVPVPIPSHQYGRFQGVIKNPPSLGVTISSTNRAVGPIVTAFSVTTPTNGWSKVAVTKQKDGDI